MRNVCFLVVRGGLCRLSFVRNDTSPSKDATESGQSLVLCAHLCIRANWEASSTCRNPHLGFNIAKVNHVDDSTK